LIFYIHQVNINFKKGKYINEVTVGYISKKGLKYRRLILFSDLILLLKFKIKDKKNLEKEISENEKLLKKKKIYELRSAITFDNKPLINLLDIENEDDKLFNNFFFLNSSLKSYCFFFKNSEKKKEWVSILNNTLNDYFNNIYKYKNESNNNKEIINNNSNIEITVNDNENNEDKDLKANLFYDEEHQIFKFLPRIKQIKELKFKKEQKNENKELKKKRRKSIFDIFSNKNNTEKKEIKTNFILCFSDSDDDEFTNDDSLSNEFKNILNNFNY
jgi:hypothetical protein